MSFVDSNFVAFCSWDRGGEWLQDLVSFQSYVKATSADIKTETVSNASLSIKYFFMRPAQSRGIQ